MGRLRSSGACTRRCYLFSPHWCDRHVDNVVCNIVLVARTRIKAVAVLAFFIVVQVDRKEQQLAGVVATFDNLLSSVAVMNVNINNCAALTHEAFIRNGMQSPCRDIVEDTETARFAASQETLYTCVVTRRPDNAKCIAMATHKNTDDKL